MTKNHVRATSWSRETSFLLLMVTEHLMVDPVVLSAATIATEAPRRCCASRTERIIVEIAADATPAPVVADYMILVVSYEMDRAFALPNCPRLRVDPVPGYRLLLCRLAETTDCHMDILERGIRLLSDGRTQCGARRKFSPKGTPVPTARFGERR